MRAIVFREYTDIDEMTGNVMDEWLYDKPVCIRENKYDKTSLKVISEKEEKKERESALRAIEELKGAGVLQIPASCDKE